MEQLGIDVDTHNTRIIYPLSKRNDLLDCINESWTITSVYSKGDNHPSGMPSDLFFHPVTGSLF